VTAVCNAALEILANADDLARRAADWMLDAALAKEGYFAVCLSGGSTPQRLYERMTAPPYRDRFPWSRMHFFWGDERFVPHQDPLSNYHMVREALLSHVPVPPENIHPIPVEGVCADEAAAIYERELKSFYGAERFDRARPLFDVTLLGLGTDGHTASLFPGAAVLAERERWVAAVAGAKPETRITLTYPALESCANAAYLVAGKGKCAVLAKLRGGDSGLPAARLNPIGSLFIFADAAAADAEEGESACS